MAEKDYGVIIEPDTLGVTGVTKERSAFRPDTNR
jgi:hypothetical protein